jgi:hypothetical protein
VSRGWRERLRWPAERSRRFFEGSFAPFTGPISDIRRMGLAKNFEEEGLHDVGYDGTMAMRGLKVHSSTAGTNEGDRSD